MPYLIIFLLLLAGYPVWQYFELKKFNITNYQVRSKKIKGRFNIIVIADLHAHVYGKDNDILIQRIKEQHPDLILIPGDMIVGKYPQSYDTAYRVFARLVKIAPVYFANGNHESRVLKAGVSRRKDYLKYEKKVRELGVHILNNEREVIEIRGNQICIRGLEIPLECYGKGEYVPLTLDKVRELIGVPKDGMLELLMAHNPMYAPIYGEWGADITVCGHNHGGLVRIPGIGSVISPQFEFFPKYDAGEFDVSGRKVFVSRGLGTHTFHIRIFNRAEVMLLQVGGEEASA